MPLFFSISPVQGFVAAARRTRDLWAGSWLLSHLAAKAVEAIKASGADLILPRDNHGANQRIALTPNRLVACGDEETLLRAAAAACDAIQDCWLKLATAVWDEFVPKTLGGDQLAVTQKIWDQQVISYWETNWIIGQSTQAAARKCWRTNIAHVEGGFRCALFPHLQELSGTVGKRKPERFQEFWEKISSHVRGKYNFEEGEALSAIGFIKRFFPLLSEVKQLNLDVESWPATAWVAAQPWLARVIEKAPSEAESYVAHVKEVFTEGMMGSTKAARRVFGDKCPAITRLDGQLLFPRGIESEYEAIGKEKTKFDRQKTEKRQRLLLAYRQILAVVKPGPVPWFAALAMDGDNLGGLLDRLGNESGKLSEALAEFGANVVQILENRKCHCVYAGGDDVLALLPADLAIDCAIVLRTAYLDCFRSKLGSAHPAFPGVSISAGLVFADWKTPLQQVIHQAHHLLDSVAKDETGRDSLAISVWLSSGLACQWAAPWNYITGGDSGLYDDLNRCGDSKEVSTSFLYGVRETLKGMFDQPHDAPGQFSKLVTGLNLTNLLHADLVRIQGDAKRKELEVTAQSIARLTQKHSRVRDDHSDLPHPHRNEGQFSFDGLRLARFLAELRYGGGE